ncbi:MAG: GtrA family protein [Bacteroidales bacterium]|jgi:putative flippase GtrA|nr:GtrA family protein [Bacteroidales bacterium]
MKLNLIKASIKLFWKIDNKFMRFLFVGVLNTAVGYGLFVFFIWIGLHYGWALLCSQILGVAFNYKSTGVLVFESKTNTLVVKFVLVYVFMYSVNLLELYLLDKSNLYEIILNSNYFNFIHSLPLDQNKIGDVIGQAIVTLPNAMLSFLLFQAFVYRKKK